MPRFRRLRNRIIVAFAILVTVVQAIAFVLVNAANDRNAQAKIGQELADGGAIGGRLHTAGYVAEVLLDHALLALCAPGQHISQPRRRGKLGVGNFGLRGSRGNPGSLAISACHSVRFIRLRTRPRSRRSASSKRQTTGT